VDFEKGSHGKRNNKKEEDIHVKKTAYCLVVSLLMLPISHPPFSSHALPPSLPPSLRVIFRLHDLVEVTKVRLHRLLPTSSISNGTRCKEWKRKGEMEGGLREANGRRKGG
jgi:hypothetical protein